MKNTIAIICLVAGAGLLVWGYRESQTIKGQFHQVFSTANNNRVTWMYVGGAVLVTAGAAVIYGGKK